MNQEQRESLKNVAYAAKLLRLQEERARQTGPGGLMHFLRYHWDVLEPSRPFVDGWVPQAIAEHLEAVTFNQITRLLINVPPGPMRDDSIVETARGPIPLRDVLIGDLVLTHRGRYRPVSGVHHLGILPTLKITTNSGRVTYPAPTHPYLTPSGWVVAERLRVGDHLAVVNREEDRPGAAGIFDEEARLLGYLVGDGGLTQATPTFTNADRDVIDDFHRCAKILGFQTSESRTRSHWTVRLNGGRIVKEWLQRHNLSGADSYVKRIPPLIMSGNRRALEQFIGAYWTCDGGFDVRPSRIRGSIYRAYGTTVSEGLATDLVYALGLLGIEARLRRKSRPLKTKKQPNGNYISYSIEVQKETMTARFSDFFSLCIRKRKIADMCRRAFSKVLWDDEIIEIQKSEDANCMCLTVEEDHSFVCSGIAVKNSMKSLMCNCFWPAFEWGPMNRPYLRGMSFSYAAHLTERDNDRLRSLVTSRKYQELWGDRFKLTTDAKVKISNDHMGWQLASSVRGISTGERADRLRLDDAHNVVEGESERVRTETVRWFKESMSNRLNDMDKSAIIVIMQRVHESDVAGTIIEDSEGMGYEHLCIPMRYETDGPWAKSTSIGWEDPRTTDGELAWPERFSAKVVDDLERDLGPFAFSAQLMQNPAPRGGGIIRRNWFRLWENPQNKFPPFENVVAAVDPAYTEKDENDPSAMVIFATFRHPETNEFGIMLVHCWRKRLPIHGDTSPRFPGESIKAYERRCGDNWGLVEWIWHCCDAYGVQQLFIEGKASGLSVYQEIERRQSLRPWSCDIDTGRGGGDKTARLTAVQPIFSQGLIWAPDRDWADMAIAELTSFPKGKYDDLCFVAGTKIITRRGEIPIEEVTQRDKVLTPFGWRRVIVSGCTGVTNVITRGGLTGTPGHRVFTLDNGFTTLDSITICSRISRLKLCDLIKIIRLSLLNSMECSTEEWAARKDIISLSPKAMKEESEQKDFMSLFGSLTLGELFQKAMRSITLTAIPLIASLKILSAYQGAIIDQCLRRILIERKPLPISLRLGPLQKFGTRLQRVVSGIGNMLSSPFRSRDTSAPLFGLSGSSSVKCAARNLSVEILGTHCVQSLAPVSNSSVSMENANRSAKNISVSGVAQSSLGQGQNKYFAARDAYMKDEGVMSEKSLRTHTTLQPVYNIAVEGSQCFYANGILVHNCDASALCLKRMREMGLIQHTDEREYDEYVEQNRPQALQPLYPV